MLDGRSRTLLREEVGSTQKSGDATVAVRALKQRKETNVKKTAKTIGMKGLAILLSVLMIVMALPMSVFAQMIPWSTEDGQSASQSAGESEAYTKEPFELVALREENAKHYQLPDGTRMVAMYDTPVHYLDASGDWQDIDNTLHENSQDFATNNARVKFVKKTTGNGEIFTLHEHNKKITVSLDGAAKRVFGVVTNTKTEHPEGTPTLQKLTTLDHLNAAILYPDILDGVDLEYILNAGDIKENIIVKERKQSYSYTFTISLNGLVASMTQQGDILISDSKTGEAVYVVPAPFMTDANGAISYDVSYTLSDNGNGGYALQVSADADWINAKDRALPVKIDPTITTDYAFKILDLEVKTDGTDDSTTNGKSYTVSSTSRVYWKAKNLPAIPNSNVISATFRVYAQQIQLSNSESTYTVGVFDVLRNWDDTLKESQFNATPIPKGTIAEHETATISCTQPGYYEVNVTPIVQKWYDENNFGLCLASKNPVYEGSVTFASSRAGYQICPALSITYTHTRGLEGYYSYATQGVGFAGSGAVNYASGELTFAISTLTTTDALFSFTPTLYYNSSLSGKNTVSGNVSSPRTAPGAPLGFQWNMGETLSRNGDTYEWLDGDGTEHVFYPVDSTGTKYADIDGLQLELTFSGTTASIKDSNHTERIFVKDGQYQYYLQSIQDTNGNQLLFTLDEYYRVTEIKVKPAGLDPINQLNIYYTQQIQYADETDNVGTCFGVPYLVLNATSGEAVVLRYIGKMAGESINDYKTGYLSKVIRAHGSANLSDWQTFAKGSSTTGSSEITVDAIATYTFDNAERLSRVDNGLSQYELRYTYKDNTTRVTGVEEYAGAQAVQGQTLSFAYATAVTKVRTSGEDDVHGNADDLLTTFVYDQYCRVVTSYTTDLEQTKFYGASHTGYNGVDLSEGKAKHSVKSSLVTTQHSSNYLLNGGFEYADEDGICSWSLIDGPSRVTDEKYDGEYSLKFPEQVGDEAAKARQYLFLPSGTYTLSFFIKALQARDCVVTARATVGSTTYSERIPVNEYGLENVFHIASLQFGVASDANVAIEICVSGTVTEPIYIDNVMLSKTMGVKEYDMMQEGHFESSYSAGCWQSVNGQGFSWADSKSVLFGDVAKIDSFQSQGQLYQVVYQASAGRKQAYIAGEYTELPMLLTLSGWGKGTAQSYDENSLFRLKLYVEYSNGTTYTAHREQLLDFEKGLHEWQLVGGSMLTDPSLGMIECIKVFVYYTNQPGTGYFDSISLIKDGVDSAYYSYNTSGKLNTARQGKNETRYEYNNTLNPSLVTRAIYSDKTLVDYTYDSKQNVTLETHSRYTGSDVDHIGTVHSQYWVDYIYNDYGMPTRHRATFLDGSSPHVIETSTVYETTSDSKLFGVVNQQIDERGGITRYFYNTYNGRLLAVLGPDGNGVSYTYDGMGNLTEVREAQYSESTYTQSSSQAVSYGYDSVTKRLSTITAGITQYTFTYDVFGNTTGIFVGSQTSGYELVSYTYGQKNGKLQEMAYGNGLRVKYVYDALDRVTQMQYNTGSGGAFVTAYSYEYDAAGRLYSQTDHTSNETTVYRYDNAGKLTHSYVYDTASYNKLAGTSVYYDEQSRVDDVYYAFLDQSGSMWRNQWLVYDYTYNGYTGYLYDLVITNYLSKDTETIAEAQFTITPTYDSIGRITRRVVEYLDLSFVQEYEYAGEYDGEELTYASNLVDSYTDANGDTYYYTYDANGYITQIANAQMVVQYAYQYDTRGQLIREDNRPLGKTYAYEYDPAGNIRYKRVYAYTNATTLEGLSPQQTINYTYGDSVWGDRLTTYNGKTITYDEIGNPTQIGNTTLTWQGRRLMSYGNNTFTYNEEGIRTSKNGREYILDGSRILAEGEELLYLYDETGSPIGMGFSTGGAGNSVYQYYFFGKNLQGDITDVYDEWGHRIGGYVYDAWGNFTVEIGSDLNSGLDRFILTDYNPFHYRGYYYDNETGLYYLNSRYYDPEIGRFINADGYVSTGQGILGNNMYAYCGNNPVNRVDPTGDFWMQVLAFFAIQRYHAAKMTVGAAPNYVEIAASNGNPNKHPNCYSYVIGEYDKSYDPGDFSTRYASPDVEAVAAAVKSDFRAMGRGCRRISSYDSPIRENEYRIALRVSEVVYVEEGGRKICKDWDYHFMVQTSSGNWAEKRGRSGATVCHPSGNPSTISWDKGEIKGYYTGTIVYFAVTW